MFFILFQILSASNFLKENLPVSMWACYLSV